MEIESKRRKRRFDNRRLYREQSSLLQPGVSHIRNGELKMRGIREFDDHPRGEIDDLMIEDLQESGAIALGLCNVLLFPRDSSML